MSKCGTQGGTAVTDIGLAVNDRRTAPSGEVIEETTFVDVTLWGRTATVAGEFLKKGSPALVEGRLKLDTWESEGQKRSKLRVVAERMRLLGSRSDSIEDSKRNPPESSNDAGRKSAEDAAFHD